jgi:hypothetical protein
MTNQPNQLKITATRIWVGLSHKLNLPYPYHEQPVNNSNILQNMINFLIDSAIIEVRTVIAKGH